MDAKPRQDTFDEMRAAADSFEAAEPVVRRVRRMRLLLPGGEEVFVEIPDDEDRT